MLDTVGGGGLAIVRPPLPRLEPAPVDTAGTAGWGLGTLDAAGAAGAVGAAGIAGAAGTETMVRVAVATAGGASASVTSTVNTAIPGLRGVPLITPEGERARPDGHMPEATD
ncbi:MAG: hypothetical protein QOF20_2171, partial [Acidimicrobiaceae bacterium]|nr:hypothetical protein [Acidimicrobiaceae bacterium]